MSDRQEGDGNVSSGTATLKLYSVSPYSDLTGAPISSVNHAQVLRAKFKSVCLVLPESGAIEERAKQAELQVLLSPVENRGFRTHLFRRSFFKDIAAVVSSRWRYYHTLCTELRQHPGIVHIHSRASVAPLALWAARRCGAPSILHIREPAYPSWLDRLSVRRLARRASAVVCVSDGIRKGYGRDVRARATVIHNFIQLPSARTRRPGHPVRVLMAARMGHRKGVDVFLEVCRLLRDRKVDVEACLVGGWDSARDQQQAMEMIRSNQLESMVEDRGIVEDMGPVYAETDILLLPARQDPLPRVIMEAMGHGLPVVSTRVDGIPEMVEEGVTGFLADSEDAEDLAAKVTQLVKDESLRQQMGEAGRARADKLFSAEGYVSAMMKLYQSLLPRSGSTSGEAACQ